MFAQGRREQRYFRLPLRLFGFVVSSKLYKHLIHTLHPEMVRTGKKTDVLAHCQVVVEGEALAQVADVPFYFLCASVEVEPCNCGLAGCGDEKDGQHPDGGGLACPAGSEKAENLSAGDGE